MTEQRSERELWPEWGQAVRRRREELGLSQFAVATKVGIQQATISQIERGEMAGSYRTRIALARVLKVPVEELFPYPDPDLAVS